MRSSAARQEHRALSRATIPGACRGLGEAWLWHRGAKELGREANTPVGKMLGVSVVLVFCESGVHGICFEMCFSH